MITSIIKKNKYCKKHHSEEMTIQMLEDFTREWHPYFLKKWEQYTVTPVKYDELEDWKTLAVSFLYLDGVGWEHQVKIFTHRFDIVE